MGSGELAAAESAGASSVRYAVSPAHLFVLLLRGQRSTAGQEVADFRSYAELRKMLRQGSIPAGIHWVMYDNEQWSLTPAGEQADPVRYERLFARLAHQHGYKVILAPAQDLVPGFDKNSFRAGHAVWKSYLSMGLATASARAADVYEIQAQPYEMSVYRSQHAYASFVAAAAAQARAANPGVVIYAGLSTQRVSDAAQLLQDYLATRGVVHGYWLNIPRHDQPGPPGLADQFFRTLPRPPRRARRPAARPEPDERVYDYQALALLLADVAVLAVIVVQPLSRRYDDSDRGRGTVVQLPPFGRQSLPRTGFFLVVAIAVGTTIIVDRHPGVAQLYHQALLHLLNWLIRDPPLVESYARQLVPLVPAAFAGYLVTAAIVMPGTIGRRIMILLHAPLFIVMSLLTDCLLGVAVTALGVRPWPAPLISMYLQYFVGYLVVFRLFFTSHQLPRLTTVPRLRRNDLRDNLTLILCLLSATGVVFAVTLTLYRTIGVGTVLGPVILIPVQLGVIDVLAVFLILIQRAGGRRPGPPAQRPPLDVIIPAYNESVCIERQLRSIDRAAGRYGGPVQVIMCDDGSTDDTRALALAVMTSFRHARGIVIQGAHAGKSRALNLALERCTADFVFRLDADCAIDQDAFIYSVARFLADPRTGLVGALHMPKEPYTTWIHRMRAFELFYSFGFLRVAQSQVDSVPCIPGSFCGFRREAALAIGGFVTGMYGEDADFTCGIVRLGYRAVIDTRVISYEDVPTTVRQLRVQRFRWGIGGRLVYTRFVPFSRDVGAPGPRFWFQMTRGAGTHMMVPAHVFLWLMSLEWAIIRPDAHHNLGKWLGFLLSAQALALVPKFLVLAYYRRLRLLPWAVLWIPFEMLKRLFLLEALLAYRMRPVKPPLPVRGRYPTWGSMLRPGRGTDAGRAGA